MGISEESKTLVFKAKSQRGLKIFFGVGIVATLGLLLKSMGSLENNSGYFVHFILLVVFCVLALTYSEKLATTLKLEVRRKTLNFEILDQSKRFSSKTKISLHFSEITGLEYEEDRLFIETSSRVYSLSTLALFEVGSTNTSEVPSRYIYSKLNERLGELRKVNRDKIPFLDRDLGKG
jgi:hypothetical protein